MVRGPNDSIYRKLAYRFSVLIGEPKEDLKERTLEKLVTDAVFIIENEKELTQGTGFFSRGIGLITNNHVVESLPMHEDLNGQIKVFKCDDTSKFFKVKIINRIEKYDIAILEFIDKHEERYFPSFKISESIDIHLGFAATVCGFPGYAGGNRPHIARGFVMSKRKFFELPIFTVQSPIAFGNSGGPVLNDSNEVVGIATIGSETLEDALNSPFCGFVSIDPATKIKLK